MWVNQGPGLGSSIVGGGITGRHSPAPGGPGLGGGRGCWPRAQGAVQWEGVGWQ